MKKKIKYTLEYTIRCSPSILFGFLSTPMGLAEWFADKVSEHEHKILFTWNKSTDTALVLEKIENKCVKYRWETANIDEFFEFRIELGKITNETILKITDFADKNDLKDQERLWNSQIAALKHQVGS